MCLAGVLRDSERFGAVLRCAFRASEHDAVGNRTSFTDPVGNTTHWTYDLLDRPVSETNELSQTRGFQYDDVGQVERIVNRNGMAVEYDYDALRRRTTERWLVGTTVVRTIDYGYDLASRLASIVDAGATLSFTYDALGRVVAATQTLAGLSTPLNYAFTFDEAGNRQSLALTIGGVADLVNEYHYDDLNRLTRVSQRPQPGGVPVAEKRVDIAYTDAGQFDTLARYADLAGTALAATTQYTWDDQSRLVSLRHAQGTTTLAGYDWGFDGAGRLTSFASLLDGTATYAYDPTDQLVGATYSTTATQPPAQAAETYAYDGNGNRTGAGFVTDANNHTVADGTYTYEYDGEGNRLRRVEAATGIVTEYAWDHRNRLTRVTEKPSAASPPSQFVEFAYDALDRRVSKSIDADADGTVDRVTYFVVDGLRFDNDGAGDHVLLTLTDPDGPSGPAAAAVDHRYLHGPAVDQILADEQVESGSTPPTSRVFWTLTDHQNTVRDLAARDAATGDTTVVTHRQFDSFGKMTAAVNPSDPSASVVDTLFGYTGREFDPETGLAYVRARYYDPALAQFVNEDPKGFAAGDANIRRYVGNHATYAVDPSGLEEAIDASSFRPSDTVWTLAKYFAGERKSWSQHYVEALLEDARQDSANRVQREIKEFHDDGMRLSYPNWDRMGEFERSLVEYAERQRAREREIRLEARQALGLGDKGWLADSQAHHLTRTKRGIAVERYLGRDAAMETMSIPFNDKNNQPHRALFKKTGDDGGYELVDIVMDHDDPGAYLQAHLIRPAREAVAFRNEMIGEIGVGFIPIIGELMDLQILVSRDPSVTRVDRAFALGSLAANVFTVGLLPNFGSAGRFVSREAKLASHTTGSVASMAKGEAKAVTAANSAAEAFSVTRVDVSPVVGQIVLSNVVLDSARREAWRGSFGQPSEGLGQLVRELPKGHEARLDLARMIREIRNSGGKVTTKGLPDHVYGRFMPLEGNTAFFRYQPSKLRIADLLEEQVHWQQIVTGQHLRTYAGQSTTDVMEILAKQRVLQHPDLSPVLKMEWLDDLARVKAGTYGK